MISYAQVSRYPRKFLALTGYTVREFQALLPYFQARFESHMTTTTLRGKPRTRRRYSTYKNAQLPTIEDKLLFILVYLKHGALQEVHATLFGLHQPDANRWIHLLHPLLNQALADQGALPARDMATATLPQGLYLHDGVERAIVRPVDPAAQRTYYSGKKKRHTVKNLVVVDAWCRIVLLTATCEGKKHDKKAADEAHYRLPAGSTLAQDLGFQGFTVAGVTIQQPTKKPRGQELAPEAKARNRAISAVRVRAEHAIGGVKRYRIVKDQLRNWKVGFRDAVMETCCGLHNFRLRFRPWRRVAATAART